MHPTLLNLLGVAIVAFCVPFILGFFPRVRIPAVALELIAGIIIGPAVLGWMEARPVVSVMASIGVAFLLFLAGLELDLSVLKGAELVRPGPRRRIALVAVRAIPALLYRPFLTWRECLASGLLQSTNLSFIVVALPTAASALLGGATETVREGIAAA